MGRLAAIAHREKSRAPMQLLENAEVSEITGVANDFRGKSRSRKVTLLSARAWADVCKELDLPQRAGDEVRVVAFDGEVKST